MVLVACKPAIRFKYAPSCTGAQARSTKQTGDACCPSGANQTSPVTRLYTASYTAHGTQRGNFDAQARTHTDCNAIE